MRVCDRKSRLSHKCSGVIRVAEQVRNYDGLCFMSQYLTDLLLTDLT